MSKYLLSAFADEYADSFILQCQELNKLGINYIEVRGIDGKNISTLTTKEIRQVKAIANDFGISFSSVGSPIGKIAIDGDIKSHIEMAKRVIGFARELNAKYIRIFSFYLPKDRTREQCKNEIFDTLERIVEVCKENGITPCHENEALIYGESPTNCLEILKHFNGDMKAVFDMGNFVLDGYNVLNAYQTLKDYIGYFHIKDALSVGAIVPAGKGEGKIKEILENYKKTMTEDMFITLEPHLQTFSGLNALAKKSFDNPYKYNSQRDAFEDAYKNLVYLL